MSRQVVLDTETTGLDPAAGHRIIEVGCVELVARRRTGRTLHYFLQPDREIDAGALEVHGITAERLAGSPRFADIVDELLAFVDGAEVLIHNAAFDLAFLDAELSLLRPPRDPFSTYCTITDTLELARKRHPGQRNSLDALCRRYGVDNSGRELHGALLDAELLTDVYLAMTGGQARLALDVTADVGAGDRVAPAVERRGPLPVIEPSAEELAAHRARLAAIDEASGGRCLWRELGEEVD